MPSTTLPVQKAEKVIKPPVKSLQLGDGYEQTFQNAIADVEEWNVTTPPMDDTDANSLEDLLNGLNGRPITWTPPYSDPGVYRLNSKITRTIVSYMRSTLQFSLKGTSNLRSFYYAPRFLKVFFVNNGYPATGFTASEIRYNGPPEGYDTPFTVDGFWESVSFGNRYLWEGPIIDGVNEAGGIYRYQTSLFSTWGSNLFHYFGGNLIYAIDHYVRVILAPDNLPLVIQLPSVNLLSIDSVKDKETGFVYTLGTHYNQHLVNGNVTPIIDTAIADSTGLEIRFRV
jgi:phage-related protein